MEGLWRAACKGLQGPWRALEQGPGGALKGCLEGSGVGVDGGRRMSLGEPWRGSGGEFGGRGQEGAWKSLGGALECCLQEVGDGLGGPWKGSGGMLGGVWRGIGGGKMSCGGPWRSSEGELGGAWGGIRGCTPDPSRLNDRPPLTRITRPTVQGLSMQPLPHPRRHKAHGSV